jgi:cysteine protease ATG4
MILSDASRHLWTFIDEVKAKLSSALNHVRYGWTIRTKTNFQTDSAIWLLGALYHPVLDSSSSETTSSEARNISSGLPILDMFKSDFISRIWFTYRCKFPVLSGSNLTTDCGWGCMLRSAQMLLAQSLFVHFLGRDWRLSSHQDRQQEAFHRQIIRWFGDYPSDQSPFSVHRLVKVGQALGKKAGDWYGPSSVAHIAKEAMQSAVTFNPLLAQLRIYVAKDCTVYIPDVVELC